jgi:hypothetical protein
MAEPNTFSNLTSVRAQSTHIELNLGNIFAIGLLSLLWWGGATWTSAWLARKDIPVLSPLGIAAQNFLHTA